MNERLPDNNDIADVFYRVADLLEVQNANPFRVRAYRFAAKEIERFERPVGEMIRSGDEEALAKLPHIEVAVADATDMRFVPELSVHVTVINGNGNEIGTHRHPFVWHPWLYHYGRNWKLPGSGLYTLQIQVAPPLFMRHDKKNGLRYFEPAMVRFDGVHIETGQKIS